jgi:adenylate cyclase
VAAPEADLCDLERCFEGGIPAVIATASADGTPNVTYLSRVRLVDGERVALSNQFFSKTVRNLAENPRASILLIDPLTYDEYRLCVVYERTERHGAVFDQLERDVEVAAVLQGMQDVFKLRAADIYRVSRIERAPRSARPIGASTGAPARPTPRGADDLVEGLAEVTARLGRCTDLETLVETTVSALADVLGFEHSLLLLRDENGRHLYTIASHGYEAGGVGSEVPMSEGIIGLTAARCTPIRLGNLRQLTKYSRSVRRSFEASGHELPEREIPMPGLADAESRLAVPAMSGGQLVAVLAVESTEMLAFDARHEAALTVVASVVANAIEAERLRDPAESTAPPVTGDRRRADDADLAVTQVRFYAADGSVFLDGDYLIKGVAGRILWSLLRHHDADGRVDFTNRELRLDPTLELPEFRDNLDSRLLLLKRRLAERDAPVQLEKTGRGRFALAVGTTLRLDAAG